MNSFAKRGAITLQNSQPVIQASPDRQLDVLLALDRMVVEVSMQLYNVNSRDRTRMRRQNRRLHAAVREHFPRVPKHPVKS